MTDTRTGRRGMTRGMTLADAAHEFWRHSSPRLLAIAFVVSVAGRLAVGDCRWSDAALPFVVLAVFPFVEWMIHVFVLH